jgi:hypothetical protein
MPQDKPRPGTEVFRDEQRDGGPRVHGHQWKDEEKPVSDSDKVADESAPEVEGGADQEGMGKGHTHPGRSRT